ncbi:MAG: YceI family protein [Pseudomonadota bacterium]|nr:YceI family protein [Pseudomonadota bacterium]
MFRIGNGLRASVLALCLWGPCAAADWILDGDASTLGFVSVKNGQVAEGHRFTGLAGSVRETGAELSVDLATVDTLIPIRNERMRDLLFEVVDFPTAVFRSDIDLAPVLEAAPGESMTLSLAGTLSLHGIEAPFGGEVRVTRVDADTVTVATVRPLVLNAASFGLEAGVERLRAIAGLNGITGMVPVNFALSFARD